MILSDRDIAERLADGDLIIDPEPDHDQQIQPASVDLRLGTEFLIFDHQRIPCIHPREEYGEMDYTTKETVRYGDDYVIHPGDFVLGTTKETVTIPDDLVANVEGRSSLGRLAIVVHATAGLVDPGYEGQITLEISNLGRTPVALTPEMRICQLTFTELSSPAERPYGAERGSKYQHQRGPQPSRLNEDPDL